MLGLYRLLTNSGSAQPISLKFGPCIPFDAYNKLVISVSVARRYNETYLVQIDGSQTCKILPQIKSPISASKSSISLLLSLNPLPLCCLSLINCVNLPVVLLYCLYNQFPIWFYHCCQLKSCAPSKLSSHLQWGLNQSRVTQYKGLQFK